MLHILKKVRAPSFAQLERKLYPLLGWEMPGGAAGGEGGGVEVAEAGEKRKKSKGGEKEKGKEKRKDKEGKVQGGVSKKEKRKKDKGKTE